MMQVLNDSHTHTHTHAHTHTSKVEHMALGSLL
jgi:hypothetical protein